MQDIEGELEAYGLSNKETKIYIKLLEFGLATSERLSKATGIPRSTVYDILKSLTHKGLAGSVIKEGVNFFEAADPTKLIEVLQEKEKKIKEAIPLLEQLKKSRIEKPTVTFYEGKEGLKTVLDDVLKSKREILIIGNHSRFIENLKWSGEIFTKTRVKRGISVKFIGEISNESKKLLPRDTYEKRQTKLLKKLNTVKSEIHLFNDKIAFITLRKTQPFGLIIEDKELSHLFKIIFGLIWNR